MSLPTVYCCRTLSYNCFQCKISFKTTSELFNHVNQKHITKYECLCCAYTTSELFNLKQHCKDKHNKYDLFHCPKCHYIGNDLNTVNQHYIQSHVFANHTYFCTNCGFSTILENDMRIHLCGNHKSRLLFCPCSVAQLTNCEKTINKFIFNCSYCNYKTNKRPQFFGHFLETHWPDYPDEEDEENDSDEYDDRYSYDRDSYSNDNYNSYDPYDDNICFICEKEVYDFNKQNMMQHLRYKHDTSINCLFCKKL